MEDDNYHEDDNFYEQQQEEEIEYERGMRLWSKDQKQPGEQNPRVLEVCPWCGQPYAYEFSPLCGWNCNECGYYPGASGGQFS